MASPDFQYRFALKVAFSAESARADRGFGLHDVPARAQDIGLRVE